MSVEDLHRTIARSVEEAVADLRREFEGRLESYRRRLESSLKSALPETPQLPAGNDAALVDAFRRIESGTSQSSVLNALIEAVNKTAGRAAFLLTPGEDLLLWRVAGFDGAVDDYKDDRLPAPDEGPWRRAISGHGYTTLSSGDCALLCSHIGSPLPTKGLLVPFLLQGRVAGLLYADTSSDELFAADHLALLTWAAARTIETLPLRERPALAMLRPATEARPGEPPLPLWMPPEEETIEPEPVEATPPAPAEQPAPYTPPVEPAVEVEPSLQPEEVEPGEEPEVVEEAEAPAEFEFQAEPVVETEPELEVETEPEIEVEADETPPPAETLETAVEEPVPFESEVTPPAEIEEAEEIAAVEEEFAAELPAEEEGEIAATEPEEEIETLDTDAEPEAVSDEGATLHFEPEAEPLEVEEAAVEAEPLESVEPETEHEAEEPAVAEPAGEAEESLSVDQVMAEPAVEETAEEPPVVSEAPKFVPSSQYEVAPPSDLSGPGWAFTTRTAQTDEEAFHAEAKRLARLLVSEIKLYHEVDVWEGRRKGNVYGELQDEIDRSRQLFDERVDEEIRTKRDYFYEELVRQLADGNADVLGL